MGETRLLTRSFFFAFTAKIFMALNFSNNALYPLYIQESGAGVEVIGVFMGLYPFAAVVSRPLIGLMIDRIGAKPVLMLGALLMTLTPLGFYLQYEYGLTLTVWIIRVFQGIGFGAHFTSYFTLAAQSAPPGRRNETVAKYGMAGMVSHLFGPVIGERMVAENGFPTFFIAMSAFCAVALIVEAFIRPPDVIKAKKNSQAIKGFGKLLLSRRMMLVFGLAVCHAAAWTNIGAFLAPVSLGKGITGFSLFFTGFSAAGIFVRLVASHWGDRFGLRRILIPNFFLYGAGLVFLEFGDTLFWIIVAGVLCGIAHGFTFPAVTALGFSLAPESQGGSAVALVTGMMDAGGAFSTMIIGHISGLSQTLHLIFPLAAAFPMAASLALLVDVLRKPNVIRSKS